MYTVDTGHKHRTRKWPDVNPHRTLGTTGQLDISVSDNIQIQSYQQSYIIDIYCINVKRNSEWSPISGVCTQCDWLREGGSTFHDLNLSLRRHVIRHSRNLPIIHIKRCNTWIVRRVYVWNNKPNSTRHPKTAHASFIYWMCQTSR